MKIFNTHSGTKEDFIPLDPNHIKIYACGPTYTTMLTLEMQEWQLFLILWLGY